MFPVEDGGFDLIVAGGVLGTFILLVLHHVETALAGCVGWFGRGGWGSGGGGGGGGGGDVGVDEGFVPADGSGRGVGVGVRCSGTDGGVAALVGEGAVEAAVHLAIT